MRGGGCDDHILSDGRLHLSPFPPAPKEQVRSIPGRIASEFAANRVQLTTDGHGPYLEAVEDAFGADIDYAQLVKIYCEPPQPTGQARYSPAQIVAAVRKRIEGSPDPAHVSTSMVERHNLTIHMAIRRFTRLTNAFSKRIENHIHATAIQTVHYNFIRIHKTLKISPAMAAGISATLWSWEDVIQNMDAMVTPPAPRGPSRPRTPKRP